MKNTNSARARCLWFYSEIKILQDLTASLYIIVFCVSMPIYCRRPEESRNQKPYPRQLCAQSILHFSGEHKGWAYANCSLFSYFRQGKAASVSSFSSIKDVSLRNNYDIVWKLETQLRPWWQRREFTQLSHLQFMCLIGTITGQFPQTSEVGVAPQPRKCSCFFFFTKIKREYHKNKMLLKQEGLPHDEILILFLNLFALVYLCFVIFHAKQDIDLF